MVDTVKAGRRERVAWNMALCSAGGGGETATAAPCTRTRKAHVRSLGDRRTLVPARARSRLLEVVESTAVERIPIQAVCRAAMQLAFYRSASATLTEVRAVVQRKRNDR